MNNIKLQIEAWYVKKDKKIRPSSVKVYLDRLRLIWKCLDREVGNISVFDDFKFVIGKIKDKWSNLSTQATGISAILILLQSYNINENLILKYRNKLFSISDKKKIKQKDKIQNYKIQKIDFENIKKNLKNNNQFLIFYLYNLIPPTRYNFHNMKVVDEFDKDNNNSELNYYCQKEKCFIFQNYKTVRTYGIQKHQVPVELQDMITEYHDGGEWLISNRNSKQYSQNSFSKIFHKIFGCGVSTLRKHYLTKYYSKLQEVLRELKRDSELMLNSPQVCLSSYIHDNLESDNAS